MSAPTVMATSRALVAAIGTASHAWAQVCLDFNDVAAWNTHRRAQAAVAEARAAHTRARVAAQLAAR